MENPTIRHHPLRCFKIACNLQFLSRAPAPDTIASGRLRSSRATMMDAKVADEVKKHFSTAEGIVSLTRGARKWICIPCKKPITDSATNLRAHLLGSPGCGVFACPIVNEDADLLGITLCREQTSQQGPDALSL